MNAADNVRHPASLPAVEDSSGASIESCGKQTEATGFAAGLDGLEKRCFSNCGRSPFV